jgi:FkbM family methyltransferase
MLQKLGLAKWPTWLRKPIVLSTFKRKKISSAPFVTRFHGKFFAGDAKNMIDYHVLSRGSFEPGLTSLLNFWADNNPEGIFLDVGANVGVHIIGTCSKYKKVIGIEPYPPLVNRLEKMLDVNSIENVEIKEFALSDARGANQFKIPDKSNLGTGRLVGGQFQSGENEFIQIQTITGDDLAASELLPFIAVKVDTEGAEKFVIKGLKITLNRDRPLVAFELLDDGAAAANDLVKMFPQNYNFMKIGSIKRKSPTLARWQQGSGDILAIPVEKAHILSHFIK